MTSTQVEPAREPYSPVEGWGSLPAGWSYDDVADVAVSPSDEVYVFTRGEHPVIVYSLDGEFLRSWGAGVFVNPHGIAVAPDGSVYCTDSFDHTVRKFSSDGVLMATLGTPGQGSDNGYVADDYFSVQRAGPPFNRPTAVAPLSSGEFYVSDGYGNARIHLFSATGDLLLSWGEPGSGPGQFRVPHCVAVCPDESLVYVADRENSRIQVFDPRGEYVTEWTDISRPQALAVDSAGYIYVAELGERVTRYDLLPPLTEASPWSRCSVLDPSGAVLERWGGTDPSTGPSTFWAAHGIAVDSRGSVYIAELAAAGASQFGVNPEEWHMVQKYTAAPQRTEES